MVDQTYQLTSMIVLYGLSQLNNTSQLRKLNLVRQFGQLDHHFSRLLPLLLENRLYGRSDCMCFILPNQKH